MGTLWTVAHVANGEEGSWLSKYIHSHANVSVTIPKFKSLMLSQYENVIKPVSNRKKTHKHTQPQNKSQNTIHQIRERESCYKSDTWNNIL